MMTSRNTAQARCYYATSTRTRCQGLAVVRYGRIALCAACDRERSTVGKGTRGVRLDRRAS